MNCMMRSPSLPHSIYASYGHETMWTIFVCHNSSVLYYLTTGSIAVFNFLLWPHTLQTFITKFLNTKKKVMDFTFSYFIKCLIVVRHFMKWLQNFGHFVNCLRFACDIYIYNILFTYNIAFTQQEIHYSLSRIFFCALQEYNCNAVLFYW